MNTQTNEKLRALEVEFLQNRQLILDAAKPATSQPVDNWNKEAREDRFVSDQRASDRKLGPGFPLFGEPGDETKTDRREIDPFQAPHPLGLEPVYNRDGQHVASAETIKSGRTQLERALLALILDEVTEHGLGIAETQAKARELEAAAPPTEHDKTIRLLEAAQADIAASDSVRRQRDSLAASLVEISGGPWGKASKINRYVLRTAETPGQFAARAVRVAAFGLGQAKAAGMIVPRTDGVAVGAARAARRFREEANAKAREEASRGK